MKKVRLCLLAFVALLCFANSQAHGQGVSGTIKAVGTDAVTIENYELSITKETKIYRLDGKERKAVTVKDLKVGQHVDVRVPGGFDKSKPAEGIATEIVIQGDMEPDIRGVVTKMRESKGALGHVFVEEKDGKEFDKIWLHITKNTKIFKLDGKNRKPATLDDLKIGVRIEATHAGKILDSDPPQTRAVEIVIVGAPELDIRGTITKTRAIKDVLGQILIEEKDGKPFDAVWLYVTKDTKIFRLEGKNRKPATFDDLKIGVRIEARGDGEVQQSDPPQTRALEIVIVAAKKKK